MSQSLTACADLLRRLSSTVEQLEREAQLLELPPLAGREWFEVLQRKLLPQLGDGSFLIVAVVGGTNIGKSVIFNHLAGYRASASSPLASGTKHPTLLTAPGFTGKHDLRELFPGFEPVAWQAAEQALTEDDRHLLFWRERPETAADQLHSDNLLLLDTPDVDSVAVVNWERADHIRQSADVLIAVLTQQKYNDAAVKQFFRKAAAERKYVIIVFNQCLLPEDEEYWPLWVGRFCEETGLEPAALFLAPNDRRAAESLQLKFHERPWPLPEGFSPTAPPSGREVNLLEELAQLRFGEIKLQTLLGSLQQLVDPVEGFPSWMLEVQRRAESFAEAASILSSTRLTQIDRWPAVPNSLMIAQIRAWWADQREGWTANVHQFYNGVGQLVTKPFTLLSEQVRGPAINPWEVYRKQEWESVLLAVEGVFDRLTWMRDLGNRLLTPRLDQLLGGNARSTFLTALRQQHDRVDFATELSALIAQELATFREQQPNYYRLFKGVDSAAAAARPAISVALFLTGVGPVGHALFPAVADTAVQGALHVAGEAVSGTVLTTVGDKVISQGAATGAGYLEAQFRRLHTRFAEQRANWLATQLRGILGSLPEELTAAAELPKSERFRQLNRLLAELKQFLSPFQSLTKSES